MLAGFPSPLDEKINRNKLMGTMKLKLQRQAHRRQPTVGPNLASKRAGAVKGPETSRRKSCHPNVGQNFN